MSVKKVYTAKNINPEWDELSNSIFQKRSFLIHLERTNPCEQRYYMLYNENRIQAASLVYSLKVNLLTFSNRKLNFPMKIIGIPVSCDASGLLGKEEKVNELISHILSEEKGIILCLNYDHFIGNKEIISMRTLPSMIFSPKHICWDSYIAGIRHPYRRRIRKALDKRNNLRIEGSSCRSFSEFHYKQYLDVIAKSKTKLEILPIAFFTNLPKDFRLNSFYELDRLLFWHITVQDGDCYTFLFGGQEYSLRERFDSYTNNLIEIIKNGFELNYSRINLGQTSEISKSRFGAIPEEKSMFLYHRNPLIRIIFKNLKNVLSYSNPTITNRIYKKEYSTPSKQKKQVNYAKTV